jgi:hypothetical protein
MISSCRWFRDQTLHLKKTNAQQVHMTSWYSMMLPPVVNHNSSIEPDAGNSAVNLRPGSPVRWTTAAFSKPQWRKLADTSLSFSCCVSCDCDYTNYNEYYINHDYITIGYRDINIKGNVQLANYTLATSVMSSVPSMTHPLWSLGGKRKHQKEMSMLTRRRRRRKSMISNSVAVDRFNPTTIERECQNTYTRRARIYMVLSIILYYKSLPLLYTSIYTSWRSP